MIYSDIIQAVVAITKRRDLGSVTYTAVNDALHKFHTAAFYPEDNITLMLSADKVEDAYWSGSMYPGRVSVPVRRLIEWYRNEHDYYSTVSGIRKLVGVTKRDILSHTPAHVQPFCVTPLSKLTTLPKEATNLAYVMDGKFHLRDADLENDEFRNGPGYAINFWCYRSIGDLESESEYEDWVSEHYASALIAGASAQVFNQIGDEVSARIQEQSFQQQMLQCRNDLMYAEATGGHH